MDSLATQFTPLAAAIGGALIGFSAVILLLGNGRIAGISGIVGQLASPGNVGPRIERAAFVAGLLLGPFLIAAVRGWPEQTLVASLPVLLVAGFLVGAGTTIGSGCTSGHGVCGMARLSPRSAVATVTFVAVAMVTVFLVRHAL